MLPRWNSTCSCHRAKWRRPLRNPNCKVSQPNDSSNRVAQAAGCICTPRRDKPPTGIASRGLPICRTADTTFDRSQYGQSLSVRQFVRVLRCHRGREARTSRERQFGTAPMTSSGSSTRTVQRNLRQLHCPPRRKSESTQIRATAPFSRSVLEPVARNSSNEHRCPGPSAEVATPCSLPVRTRIKRKRAGIDPTRCWCQKLEITRRPSGRRR